MPTLHPNSKSPTSWRVQVKYLKEQVYFPFSDFGTGDSAVDAAYDAAKEYEGSLEDRKKAYYLRKELGVNKLFDKNGNLKSIHFYSKTNTLKAQATVNGKQKSCTRSLYEHELKDALEMVFDWRMDLLGIEVTPEIKRLLNECYKLLQKQVNRAAPPLKPRSLIDHVLLSMKAREVGSISRLDHESLLSIYADFGGRQSDPEKQVKAVIDCIRRSELFTATGDAYVIRGARSIQVSIFSLKSAINSQD